MQGKENKGKMFRRWVGMPWVSSWKRKTRQEKRRAIVFCILFVLGWYLFYWCWRLHTVIRSFTSPEIEARSFWIVFVAENIFLFFIAKQLFRPEKVRSFTLWSLLLLVSASLAEYVYVIPSILGHLQPRPETDREAFFLDAKLWTFGGILVRDFLLFSVPLFGQLYRNALAYGKAKEESRKARNANAELHTRLCQYVEHEHFVNNALNVVSGQVAALPDEQRNAFQHLLDIQRFSFTNVGKDFIPLEQEIQFAVTLLEYYRLRFPGLEVRYRLEGEVPPYSIPPMLTEIPISNMFKHGILQPGEGKMEVVFGFEAPARFKMVCRNRIQESQSLFPSPDSVGIGILTDRLKLAYGEDASFDLRKAGDEAVAALEINL